MFDHKRRSWGNYGDGLDSQFNMDRMIHHLCERERDVACILIITTWVLELK
jgi:hypothetical protein